MSSVIAREAVVGMKDKAPDASPLNSKELVMNKPLTRLAGSNFLTLVALATLGISCSSSDSGGGTSQSSAGASGQSSSTPQAGSGGNSNSGGASSSSPKGGSNSGGASGGASVSVGGSSSAGGAGRGGSSSTVGGVSSAGAGSSSSGVAGSAGASSTGVASSATGAGSSGSTGGIGGTTLGGRTSSAGGASSSGTSTGGSGTGGSTGGTLPVGTPVKSAGCGKTSTLKFGSVPNEDPNAKPGSGSTVGTGQGGWLTAGGRGFALRLPDNYDNNKPYWLFFGFHWRGGTADQVDNGGTNGYVAAHYGLQKLSNNGAFFVAPQGNGGGWGNGDADLQFVDEMIKTIEDNYCIDTTRLYANGFSWGGGMSYALACARAKVFRAVAIYDGTVLSGCTGGNDPIAYWQMGGLEDTTCTIGGEQPMRDKFAKNNKCTLPAQEPPQPPKGPPYLKTGGHVCTDYQGCSDGHPLRWCVHQSGHGWAVVDGNNSVYNECATAPKTCSTSCPCTWVSEDVWKFFTSL